jgi:thiol-disulfide isomerase/thioredoxin
MSTATIQAVCPHCGATLRCRTTAQDVTCPRCSQPFSLDGDAPDRAGAGQPTLSLPPRSAPAAVTPAEEGAPPQARQPETLTLDAPARRRRKAESGTLEVPREEEDDERPARRGKGRRAKKAHEGRSPVLRVALAGGLGFLLVGLAVGAAMLAKGGKKTEPAADDSPVAQKPPGPEGPRVPPPDGGGAPRLLPPLRQGSARVGINVGDLAPEIVGEDLNGAAQKLSDYRGKVVLLDFWGDWCPPCRACYPHEKALVLKLAGRPFVMLGVNADKTADDAKRATQRDGLNWASWFDADVAIRKAWNIRAIPTFYLIDHNGVIRKTHTGYSEAALKRLALEAEELVRDAEQAR